MKLEKLNPHRIITGLYKTVEGQKYGAFRIPHEPTSVELMVMCSPFDGRWQHVSVSLKKRCPNWVEMCFVKDLFWSEDETVVQFHPKKTEYVNNHPFCLHMWRDAKNEFNLPPQIMV